jgi:acyl-CoA thioester hydrolase
VSVFFWPARVYWEDTDGGGVVYYANYLRFLERARTEWLRATGFSQSDLARDPGVLFSVVEVNIKYLRPARLDDLLLVSCEPAPDGAATIIFAQRMLRGSENGELLAEAQVRVACVGAANFKARRVPPAILREIGP